MLGEHRLNQFALLCGLAGIVFLFYYSYSGECPPIPAGKINEGMLEKEVCVRGMVEWAHLGESALLFGINDGNRVKVVLFNPRREHAELVKEGALVSVRGKVQEYRGELEIVALEIK